MIPFMNFGRPAGGLMSSLASKLAARQSQSATGQNTSNNIQDLTSRVSALESAQQPAVGSTPPADPASAMAADISDQGSLAASNPSMMGVSQMQNSPISEKAFGLPNEQITGTFQPQQQMLEQSMNVPMINM
jgi:hypothetical protein